MHLRIKPDGSVHLSAPREYSLEQISRFAHSKLNWIKKHLARLEKQGFAKVMTYTSGEELMLFGEKYVLSVVEGSRYSLLISGQTAVLTAPKSSDTEHKRRFVNEWYRERLREKIAYFMPKWEQLTGLYSSSWQIKNMNTYWGTCNTRTKKIWFNLKLALVPERCLWYVILHELAHLKERNHGPRFESILERHMPDWRDVCKKLNEYSNMYR